MIFKKAGIVDRIITERPGAQEIEALVGADRRLAINYPALTGMVELGDTVILNITATTLNLGTGGFDFVIHVGALPDTEITEGHLIKLRYTPLQFATLSAEEKHADQMESSLEGTPIICCGLHSQIVPAAFALKSVNPEARTVYLMTDAAALPLGFSRLAHSLKEKGLLSGVITCGQAFGGDLEAVNIYSAMLLAKSVLNADAIIISQGPGNTGTGTDWGFSAVDQGQAINAAHTLGGTPICCLRMSHADARERHQNISHHTITALKRIALAKCKIAVPMLADHQMEAAIASIKQNKLDAKHEVVVVDTDAIYENLLKSNLPLSSMGRAPSDDPAFYKAALAAGMIGA